MSSTSLCFIYAVLVTILISESKYEVRGEGMQSRKGTPVGQKHSPALPREPG